MIKDSAQRARRSQATIPTHCPKLRYRTYKIAAQAANRSTRASGEDIHAYRCDTCRAWHIGHVVPSWQRNGAR